MGGERKMNIYIYKYTNKVTGNSYIGKTNNIERRKREHKSNAYNSNSSFYTSMWCKKIREYGYENFDFEVLETANAQNWQEREKYWIEYYNTFNGKGYNSNEGGEGDGIRYKKLTDEQANEVRELLLNGNEIQSIIASNYNISNTLLSNINQGLKYVDESLPYPLRKNYRNQEDYDELLYYLKETKLSFRLIALEVGMAESTVKKINYGKLCSFLSETYPIRPYSRLDMVGNKGVNGDNK